MRSNSFSPTSGSRLRAQNSRIFGSSAETRRGVNTRESRLRCDVVRGRIFEDECSRRELDVRLDQLEDAAASRDESLRVDEALLAVLVAAHRVEVVLLVVVERRLVAQPLVERVRVVEVDRGVRVVGEIAHRWWPFSSSMMRSGESGKVVTVTSNGVRASATALTTAGGAPIAPPSPTPL